ncbi:hypothetical protein L596_009930 [Steinernema carpocapsae]|uniref:Uncharacterized protein n=1 Tax=Steinernema carpocapsae TaxID=34508 RepID=A0A4U5PH30_STECR|nr:hypothetical protein L596_009930 [Steinernema carpocapsae]
MACCTLCACCFAFCCSPLRSLVKIRYITFVVLLEFIFYQVLGFFAVSWFHLISLVISVFFHGLMLATVFWYKRNEFVAVFSIFKLVTIGVSCAYLGVFGAQVMQQCNTVNEENGSDPPGEFISNAVSGPNIETVLKCFPVNNNAEKVIVMIGLFITIIMDLFFALMYFRYYRHLRNPNPSTRNMQTPLYPSVTRQGSAEPMCQQSYSEVFASPVANYDVRPVVAPLPQFEQPPPYISHGLGADDFKNEDRRV